MTPRLRWVVAFALLLASATPAYAHRLDEYLQATMISVGKDRVQVQLRLTPGVNVFPVVFAEIDTDKDGLLSGAEQRAYAERVVSDLSLAVDGDRLALRLIASKFASVAEMQEGRGEIQIDLDAVVPLDGGARRLTFANHHRPTISVYLVNALVSRDPDIRVEHQSRNFEQSLYQLDYQQAGAHSSPFSLAWWSGVYGWLGLAAVAAMAQAALLLRRKERGAVHGS